jgi:hypothetical protein
MQADEIKQVVGAEKNTLHKIVLAALQNFTDNTGLVVYGMAWTTYTAQNADGEGLPEATIYVMERSDIGVNG